MKAPFCPNDSAHGRLYQLGTIGFTLDQREIGLPRDLPYSVWEPVPGTERYEWEPDDFWSCDYCPPGYNRFYRNERHACMVPTFESLDVRKELYG